MINLYALLLGRAPSKLAADNFLESSMCLDFFYRDLVSQSAGEKMDTYKFQWNLYSFIEPDNALYRDYKNASITLILIVLLSTVVI